MAENAQEFQYKAEMKQLLHLIVHSLYTHPEIFLRELISNASDALNKVKFRQLTDTSILDFDAPLEIKITADKETRSFTIEDSGIGMSKDDLVNKLGTIASSGTLEFLESLKAQGKAVDGNMIGQFGVGFYSTFMVADNIVVETRSADADSKAWRWESDGKGAFTIAEIEKATRGTKITFTLREDSADFSESYRITSIIKKYSNFVDFPIYVGDEKINVVRALWQLPKDQVSEEDRNEFYKYISNDWDAPLGHLHFSIEGAVNFKALLFIPETAPQTFFSNQEKSLHLYVNKVLIQDDCKDLLPEYLRFVKGVVDTEDLPLNVSRETAQASPVMTKINKTLTTKILGYLDELATNNKEAFEKWYRNFNPLFKTGVNQDFSNRDKIIDLLRFESSTLPKGELTSLKEYVGRMKEDQNEIFYLTGEHRDTMTLNPNLEYFRKNNIEVLLLTEAMDVIIIPSIPTYSGKTMKSVEKADIDMKSNDAERMDETSSATLLEFFKTTLGDKVENVVESKRLVDSAVTLVVGAEGLDPHTEKVMKYFDKNFSGAKKILEVNLSHPLIKKLAEKHSSGDKNAEKIVVQLFEGALLMEGNLPSPAEFVKRMTEILSVEMA